MNIDQEFIHLVGNSVFALETELSTLRKRVENWERIDRITEVLDALDSISDSLKSKVLTIKEKIEV